MSTEEFRKYAAECLAWARKARTEQEREAFINLAETWLAASLFHIRRHGIDERDDSAVAEVLSGVRVDRRRL